MRPVKTMVRDVVVRSVPRIAVAFLRKDVL